MKDGGDCRVYTMHMNKTIAGLFISGALLLPFAASALTVDEIQSQIRELLAKVTALQSELKIRLAGTTATSTDPLSSAVPVNLPPLPRVCNLLDRTLMMGTRGDDVMGLQEFLKANKLFSGEATGYFGALTRDALRQWQAQNQVVSSGDERTTGWGLLGPNTRNRIKAWCGGNMGNRLNANPTRGDAPLNVTFSTNISGFRSNSVSYTIDFGDGTSERAADCFAPADGCERPGENKHTYSANGSYTATLNKITDPCPDDGDPNTPRCLAAIHSEVISKVQIHVGPVSCTKEYMPVCGGKQVQCITTPCNPVPTTYSNRCLMEADGAQFMYAGACRTDAENPEKNPQCKTWNDGCNTCSRSEPGGPAACTLRYCTDDSLMRAKPYCSAYFDSTSNRAPVISGFSGPVSLAVNETGTWSISASDPENQQLKYSIVWGDEWYKDASMRAIPASESIVQQTTFTHSYSRPGTYKVSISVWDPSGGKAESTATVQVQQTVCTADYAPVCGRPVGCNNSCPQGMICAAMVCMPHTPQTYSNRCVMNNANAELVHEGACTTAETQ